jgi:hypothetical protein
MHATRRTFSADCAKTAGDGASRTQGEAEREDPVQHGVLLQAGTELPASPYRDPVAEARTPLRPPGTRNPRHVHPADALHDPA